MKNNKQDLVVMIPARIGSKGIPRKVIRPFNGRPLLFYTIDLALNIPNAVIYINTDSNLIYDLISKEYKSKVKIFLRDKKYGDDDVTLDELVLNFIAENNFNEDHILTIQPTSPLIRLETILNFVNEYKKSNYNSLITVKENRKLEWEKNKKGVYKPIYKKRLNRQLLKPKYTETGALVISKIKLILSSGTRFNSNTGIFLLNFRESIDIDTYEDWLIAETLFKSKKIIFYTSANKKLGSGHLKRCMSLAFSFPSYDIQFILHKTDSTWIEKLKLHNYKFIIDETNNLIERIKLFTTFEPLLIIIDNLNTSEKFIKSLRTKISGVKIISFEDLGKGSLHTDLTINELYPPVINSKNILSGPDYCFFREEFLRVKFNTNKKIKTKNTEKKYDIIISFGGTDPNNLTVRVLKILNQINSKPLKIRVILGLGAQNIYNSISNLANNSIHEIIYHNPEDGLISNEFIDSKIGITGGGRTVYEFNVCNVKTIVICQNSRELTHLYASEFYGINNLGLHSEVKDMEIHNKINFLLNNKEEKDFFKIDPKISNNNIVNHINQLIKKNV